MNDNQLAQKIAARNLSIKCGEGLGSDLLPKGYYNESADVEGMPVGEKNRAQGMRAEMGEKI